MRRTVRTTLAGAGAALTVALAGCGTDTSVPTTPDGAPPAPAASALATEPANAGQGTAQQSTAQQGVTQASDVYGPGCNQVPTSGPGSVESMTSEPVGTAASNNPLLSTLTQAVQAAGLTDTLNDPNASYTVFAPANPAFDALPPGTLDQLLANPTQLGDILRYHVVPQRYTAQQLADAGTVTTVQGNELTISGQPESLTIDEQEQASVLCGNIPTANATVFVIDQVLMP